jgi:galactose mutarotase-like enzyme
MSEVTVAELDSIAVDTASEVVSIQRFSLSRNGVTVELSSLGAAISRFSVPSSTQGSAANDDIVLGFDSPKEALLSNNPSYLGAIVGRVANRIAKGHFELANDKGGVQEYQLETNNGANHLHGGSKGFSNKIWDAQIVDDGSSDKGKAVLFTLLSEDGDQGYPGSVLVTATYSLQAGKNKSTVKLCLDMKAVLQGKTSTPINLAQHSYFNLSNHADPGGILDHKLTLNADAYTPVDSTGIPTRQVGSLDKDSTMDWRNGRLLREALVEYGVARAGLTRKQAEEATKETRSATDVAKSAPSNDNPGSPYGFDHNYVLRCDNNESGLHLAGILEHPAAGRRLSVWTDAPGVQLYTANYLDGKSAHTGEVGYRQWQGLCLETQHFPDSVFADKDDAKYEGFYNGKCVILRPETPHYSHSVEYELEFSPNASDIASFRGSDSEGRQYASLDEMWKVQGVLSDDTASESWYDRAAEYYEENCPASLDGVLGGFANISDLDLQGSLNFMRELEALRPLFRWSSGAACECGAGIGRVSKGLLLTLGVTRCDLVESSARLISAAPDYLGEVAGQCRYYCTGLQEWEPSTTTYSVIWIQWVFCYLTDTDAVAFLRRCGESLVDGGVIVLKENTCNEGDDFVVDVDDASVTRSVPYLIHLADQAGLRVLFQRMQDDFPDEIYPVPMIALGN